MENNTNHKLAEVSTSNMVPAYKENQKAEDIIKIRDKCIKAFWGGKTPKQKKADKDKEIEDIINNKK